VDNLEETSQEEASYFAQQQQQLFLIVFFNHSDYLDHCQALQAEICRQQLQRRDFPQAEEAKDRGHY